jgi:hypothetical protein
MYPNQQRFSFFKQSNGKPKKTWNELEQKFSKVDKSRVG